MKGHTRHTCDREGPPDIHGAEPATTLDEIERTRRALAWKLHPDASPDDTVAINRFREVAGACHLSSDPGRRAEFDARGWQHGRAGGVWPERARQPGRCCCHASRMYGPAYFNCPTSREKINGK